MFNIGTGCELNNERIPSAHIVACQPSVERDATESILISFVVNQNTYVQYIEQLATYIGTNVHYGAVKTLTECIPLHICVARFY